MKLCVCVCVRHGQRKCATHMLIEGTGKQSTIEAAVEAQTVAMLATLVAILGHYKHQRSECIIQDQ